MVIVRLQNTAGFLTLCTWADQRELRRVLALPPGIPQSLWKGREVPEQSHCKMWRLHFKKRFFDWGSHDWKSRFTNAHLDLSMQHQHFIYFDHLFTRKTCSVTVHRHSSTRSYRQERVCHRLPCCALSSSLSSQSSSHLGPGPFL